MAKRAGGTLLLPVAALISVAMANEVSAQPPGEGDVSMAFLLCEEASPAPALRKWRRNVLFTSRVFQAAEELTKKEIGVEYGPCEGQPDAACFAGPRRLLCREAVLARVLRASAWTAARYVTAGEPAYEQYMLRYPRDIRNAFRFADGAPVDPKVDELVERVRAAEEAQDHDAKEPVAKTWLLYQAIADYNLIALLGHELFHANGDVCPLDRKSKVEEDGLLDQILKLQGSNDMFCPRNPRIEEVKADRCAFRQMRKAHESIKKTFEGSAAAVKHIDFVRRASADLIAFQFMAGWRPTGPNLVLQDREEYFYPPFRLFLAAMELHGESTGVPVCGEAAALFVHGVQEMFKKCPSGGGEVPDLILDRLPKGVTTGWEKNDWNERSFSCER